jgi:hypothetical protein
MHMHLGMCGARQSMGHTERVNSHEAHAADRNRPGGWSKAGVKACACMRDDRGAHTHVVVAGQIQEVGWLGLAVRTQRRRTRRRTFGKTISVQDRQRRHPDRVHSRPYKHILKAFPFCFPRRTAGPMPHPKGG